MLPELPSEILYPLTAAIGLILGSFLNVVIYRLPRMLEHTWHAQCRELLVLDPGDTPSATPFNLVYPPSTCPHCGERIRALENIPLLSYLLQRGCCRHCGVSIGLRYPLVELLTMMLALAIFWRFGLSIQGVTAFVLTCALIALAFIDLDHQLLPDNITLPFLWLGIALSFASPFATLPSSVIGAMAGYLSLWGVYHLFRLITGKEGMGYGDFKLLALLGAWLGWQSLPLIILISSIIGAFVGITLIAFRKHHRDNPIPFGPYLAAAGWIALMWGQEITSAYFAQVT